MKPIDFHPDAAQEANDAVDYYDGLRPGLGDDFRVELDAALDHIQQNPHLYAVERGRSGSAPCIGSPSRFTTRSWQTGFGWLRSATRAAALGTGHAGSRIDSDQVRAEPVEQAE